MSSQNEILTYIPQRPPFVMVDEITGVDDSSGKTRFIVTKENIFFRERKLTEPALIENIAQTAAARIGYLCHQNNEPVPVGFIGAVQNLEINRLPLEGQLLETEITIKNQVFNVTLIKGVIHCNGTRIAQCDMKIFIQKTIDD